MTSSRRLMAVLAHPDDESLGCGGTLARYAGEGVETCLVTATRGEGGRHGPGPHPGRELLGRIREEELRAAARVLDIGEVHLLGCEDGALDRVHPEELRDRIAMHIRRFRPQVVLTFGPDGAYGHPDHVAISQATTASLLRAADSEWAGEGRAHSVSKLYFMAWGRRKWEIYQKTFKTLASTVDGVVREAAPWPDWAITTRVDARPWWPRVWEAVQCHRTQMTAYGPLAHLSAKRHATLWGDQSFYRAMSLVNGGREPESDLFQGVGAGEEREEQPWKEAG